MSKKTNKQKETQPVLKQEIPIQEDPYWKVSHFFLDPQRLGRFAIKFERFDEEHPEWTQMLLEGVPTLYCILGVSRGAMEEEIEIAYAKKLRFSSYPTEFINEAYDVLMNKSIQKEYDELLLVFEQITKCMDKSEKNEIIQYHNEFIKREMDFVRMGEVQPQYVKFLNFYLLGAPELYEIIGLNPKSLSEDIIKRCETGSELFKKICTILGDPSKRGEYDFVMYFVERYGTRENHEERSRNAKKWEKIDRNTIEKILINSLDHSDVSDKPDLRLNNIISANQDWKLYLPPGKETFFSILGIEKRSLSCDKKEIEKILREKYRYLEKTNKVNLAYSVLKNESQRADYLWLSDNIDMFNALEQIYSKEEEEVPLINKKKRKGQKKQGVKKKPPSQITFDDLERMMEQIFEMEAMGKKKRMMK